MSDLLENLKVRIESSGMSYRELASKTGISAAAVCRYVNSKQIPNAYTVLAFANAFNCTPNDLYGIVKEENGKERKVTAMNLEDYATIWDTMEKYGVKELKITRLEDNEFSVQLVCTSELLDKIAHLISEDERWKKWGDAVFKEQERVDNLEGEKDGSNDL